MRRIDDTRRADFFRLLQGIFGAGLVPLSQAILTDIFPPEERGKAMAIWGVGVMVGPILGPTLGGYLTDVTSWRWTFYVNIPVGLFTLLLMNVIPDTPKKNRLMDWPGLILISVAIGGIQYVLDRGNQSDWFGATNICVVSYLSITCFLGFILHNFRSVSSQAQQAFHHEFPRYTDDTSVFDLRIFKDRNFAIASILLCIFGLGLYGMMVIQPIMLEGLFDYPALTTGLMMAPRGISGMVSMMLVGKLISRVDGRLLIAIGVFISVLGMSISTHYSLNSISPFWLVYPMLLQGFGLGMILVPLSTIAFSTLPLHMRTEAAGLYSLLRTIGCSMGISITITLFTRRSQLFWNQLGANMDAYNPALYHYLNPLNLQPQAPLSAALLGNELYRQSAMLSFVNVFEFITWSFVLMLPLILLLKSGNKPARVA